MHYQSLNLRKTKRATLLALLRTGSLSKVPKSEWRQWQEVAGTAMKRGEVLLAGNALLLMLYHNYAETFKFLRKRGVLRYYTYAPGPSIVREMAAELLIDLPRLAAYQPADQQYLQSVVNLAELHPALTSLHTIISKEIDRFQRRYPNKSLIKSLLVYAESLFLFDYQPPASPDAPGLAGKTKEAITEAVSYLIYYLTQHRPAAVESLQFISEEYILRGRIELALAAACTLDELKEAEIMVADFGYYCIRQGRSVRLLPPSEAFARSLKLGYIRTELQAYNDNWSNQTAIEVPSLQDFVQQLIDTQHFSLLEKVANYNYERYRMVITVAYDEVVNKLLTWDIVFAEEVLYMSHIFKEQLLTPVDFNTIQLRPNLSLYDFLRINRVFHFLYALFSSQLKALQDVAPEVVLRSLVPMFNQAEFAQMLGAAFPAEKTAAYLDVVSWQPGREYIFDLQYHPVVLLAQKVLIPVAILVQSNPIRNAFASERKRNNQRLNTDGTDDALIAELVAAFTEAGIPCYPDTKLLKSDLDLLVVWDDTLFFLECKQSLLPVSAFDLRTTHDYVRKAEQQLDYINQLYDSGQLGPHLADRYKFDLKRIKRSIFGIVLGNRMLNGNAFRYPVRHVHELVNLLTRGRLHTSQGTFRQWQGERLALVDVLHYFDSHNELFKLLHQSLSVKNQTLAVGPLRLEQDDYFLDFPHVQVLLGSYTATLVKESGPDAEPKISDIDADDYQQAPG